MDSAKKDLRLPAKVLEKQLNLPFDQYQRYRMVADVIERLREGSGPLQVLDVGGDSPISVFLPEDRITAVEWSDGGEVFAADRFALPFEDEAFDYVISANVYEHIEPEARDKYLSELRRTVRKGVLLVAPFDSAVVREAERMANEFHRAMHLAGNALPAGRELPKLDDARRFFEEHEDTVSVLPNGYIPHWLAMSCLALYGSRLEGESSGIFDRINAFYNEHVYESDNAEPCYRYLLVSLKEAVDASLNKLASSNSDPERTSRDSTLFGALSAVLPLVTEVKQLNTRLAQKEGALTRKEVHVNDLSRRLGERVSAKNARQVQLERRLVKLQRDYSELCQQNEGLKIQRDLLQKQLDGITGSRTWRMITAQRRFRSWIGSLGSG